MRTSRWDPTRIKVQRDAAIENLASPHQAGARLAESVDSTFGHGPAGQRRRKRRLAGIKSRLVCQEEDAWNRCSIEPHLGRTLGRIRITRIAAVAEG